MTKLLPLIFMASVFCTGSLKAQTYHKLLDSTETSWYIFNDAIGVKPAGHQSTNSTFYPQSGKYSAKTDTVIGSHRYKRFYQDYYTPGFNNPNLVGFMREDTVARQVYFLDQAGTEDLLYDFSLSIGNTVSLNFPDVSGSLPQGTYTVVAVDTVLTRVGYRKQLSLLTAGSDTLRHIESIGSIIHPVYLYGTYYHSGQFEWTFNSCSYPYEFGLACKYSNTTKYYQSCTYLLAQMSGCIYEYDSCNYYNACNALHELNTVIQYKLSPNPAYDKATIDISMDREDLVYIEVYDVTGRVVKTVSGIELFSDANTIPLDVSTIENGYYFIKIAGKSVNLKIPLVISR